MSRRAIGAIAALVAARGCSAFGEGDEPISAPERDASIDGLVDASIDSGSPCNGAHTFCDDFERPAGDPLGTSWKQESTGDAGSASLALFAGRGPDGSQALEVRVTDATGPGMRRFFHDFLPRDAGARRAHLAFRVRLVTREMGAPRPIGGLFFGTPDGGGTNPTQMQLVVDNGATQIIFDGEGGRLTANVSLVDDRWHLVEMGMDFEAGTVEAKLDGERYGEIGTKPSFIYRKAVLTLGLFYLAGTVADFRAEYDDVVVDLE